MIDPQSVGTWVGIGAATVATGFAVWKRSSRDSTEIASNREERTWIVRSGKVIELERKRADEAVRRERETWLIHLKDAEELARLKGENETMRRELALLDGRIMSLRRIVYSLATPEQRVALGSEFGDLNEG